MPEVIGIDHIYIAVNDLRQSERFYDIVMSALGFKKNTFQIAGDPHIQYFNRHFGYVLRPARTPTTHDSYAPGLHHLCFRVETEADVRSAAKTLSEQHIRISEPQRYPQYADDYFAFFLADPDGIRLEVTNYRRERRERHDHWTAV
jgi:catechol 2,3-dioxygenase-like lactoylglutathione lyase family enzyme